MAEEKEVFSILNNLNVNEHVEKKNTGKATLSYLSWTWAWKEVKSRYPNATYEVVKFENGLPYSFDPKTGYMVYTKVTIEGITHEMWLPVMDGRNDAMLDHPVQHSNSYGKTWTTEACTMFDVNKTIMRCLTKNLAMFGLGLYIYAGEDLPEVEDKTTQQSKGNVNSSEVENLINTVNGYISKGMIAQGKDLDTAKSYISTKDVEGLKKVIVFFESKRSA